MTESNSIGSMGLPTPSRQVEESPVMAFQTSEQRNSRFEESHNNHNNVSADSDFGLSHDVFMAVIDSYFTYCHNQPYSFFHEQTFRDRLSNQAIPSHLVLAVMATAVRFCSHPYFTDRSLDMSVEYANRSWKLIVSDCFTVERAAESSAVQTVALLGLFDFTGTNFRKLRITFVFSLFLGAHSLYSWSIAPWLRLGQSWSGCPDGTGLRADAGQRDTSLIRRAGRTAKGFLVSIPLRQISLLRPRSTTGYCRCIMSRTAALRRVDLEGGSVGKNAILRRYHESNPLSRAKTMPIGPSNRYCACLGTVRAVCASGF